MTHPTPHQQAENIVKGVKNAYEVVAVRHLHPNWVWWLSGLVLAFAGTMLYVANLSGQFVPSSAQMIPAVNSLVLSPELGATPIGKAIEQYIAENQLQSARVEDVHLTNRDGVDILEFGDSVLFNMENPSTWQEFQNSLLTLSREPILFELILNENLSSADPWLVLGPNLPEMYNNYFLAAGPSNRGTVVADQCRCDVSIDYYKLKVLFDGSEEYVIENEAGEEGLSEFNRTHFGSGKIKTFNTSLRGKPISCKTAVDRLRCTKDYCAAYALPAPTSDTKIEIVSIKDGLLSGTCQTAIKAR